MEWQVIVALVIAIPVILFPAAFVWYLNISGVITVVKRLAVKKLLKRAPVTD